MTADERVNAMASERLADVHGGEIALVGDDNPYFRAIRKAGAKFGITVVDGFRDTMPVLVDAHSGKECVLTEQNDIDHLVTDGMSCVAEATLILLRSYGLVGKHVAVVGRGHAVKGLAAALLKENATVTVCHSHTRFLSVVLRCADIVVVAAPIKERFRGLTCNVFVDIAEAFKDREEPLKMVCDYTRHIGKLTVAILLERLANKQKERKAK
jgi:hypothetical protein